MTSHARSSYYWIVNVFRTRLCHLVKFQSSRSIVAGADSSNYRPIKPPPTPFDLEASNPHYFRHPTRSGILRRPYNFICSLSLTLSLHWIQKWSLTSLSLVFTIQQHENSFLWSSPHFLLDCQNNLPSIFSIIKTSRFPLKTCQREKTNYSRLDQFWKRQGEEEIGNSNKI